MKRFLTIMLLSIFILVVSGCTVNGQSKNKPLSVIAATSEMKLISSNNQVEDFLSIIKDFNAGYETDVCFNITPDFITDNSSFKIFKYDSSSASFLMFDNEIYALGNCFGGFGVTSMALADLDGDNQYEFYFTFSWGSGLHRSQIGYFNPTDKEVIIFDYSHLNKDMMLTTNETGDLLVNEAYIDFVSFVDFTLKSDELLGSIVLERKTISLELTNGND